LSSVSQPDSTADVIRHLRRRIARLRPDWDPDRLSGFLYLEGGYSNRNFRFAYAGERYVLRAPWREGRLADRRLEEHLYAHAADVGMPEVIAFDARTGEMISRWVPGQLLADQPAEADGLVVYLQRLHRALPPVARRYDPVEQARVNLEYGIAPVWVEKQAERMVWAPEHVQTCHNDLNPWNVIRTPSGDWVTLDWEWCGSNDPLFDLVTLHQGAELEVEALAPLAERLLGEPAEAERLKACLIAFWLRETTWAMAEIAAGNDRPEIREQRRVGLESLEKIGVRR
jgi:aminoglycoside phosphotransferase (APT) family kinase protein